jgi:hypothetical protein
MRAGDEGTTMSALIRRWVGEYADSGWPLPREGLPRFRLSKDERLLVTAEAVADLDIASVVLRALNTVCDNGTDKRDDVTA